MCNLFKHFKIGILLFLFVRILFALTLMMSNSFVTSRSSEAFDKQSTNTPSANNIAPLSINVTTLLQDNSFQVTDPFPLSESTYAICVLGIYKSTTSAVAKLIDLERSSIQYRSCFLPRDQLAIKSLKHASLVEIFHSKVLSYQKFLLFIEYCPGGSLLDLLLEQRPSPLSETTARIYYCQFGDALRYMHEKGYAHRNVKCEKILLNNTKTHCKLSLGITRSCFRYNFAQPLLDGVDSYCASAAYVAPEVLAQESGAVKQQPYNLYVCDVWSAGCILYAMVHGGQLPFREWNLGLWIKAQRTCTYKIDKARLSPALCKLIQVHLTPNPENRPSMEEVFKHQWFTLYNDDSNK